MPKKKKKKKKKSSNVLKFSFTKTLNYENNHLLNHESLSKIVKKQIKEITIVYENKITRKNKEIINKYCEKLFKFGYDKRVIKSINQL